MYLNSLKHRSWFLIPGSLRLAKCVTVAACLLATHSLRAHDFWLEPDDFTPADGGDVAITFREGVSFNGSTLPYITEWFNDFSITDNDGRSPIVSVLGDDPAATISPLGGQSLLGYQSNRAFVELEAKKFNSYLEDEGIEFIREERRKRGEDDEPAPEYFVRCAKALLQSSADGPEVWDTQLGYALELMPLTNPYAASAGDSL